METPGEATGLFRGQRGRLTAGLFLLESLGAVQALIVVTIMPAVIRDLGDVQLYGWAFSASGLATVAAIPLSGRAMDRFGPIRPLALMNAVFAVGTIMAGLAPSMPVLIAGRFLQGLGAGAQYAISLGTVAKTYPEHLRPRVVAILSTAWVLPGLVGPSIAALMASTVGWRWAFLAVLPVLVLASALVFPGLAALPRTDPVTSGTGVRWALQLAAGSALLLSGLTTPSLWTAPFVLGGGGLAVQAFARLMRPPDVAPDAPDGAGTGGSGALAIVAAAAFLAMFAFFAADGFVPLLLTRLRGRSVLEASIVVTAATVAWSVGAWWQARAAATWPGRSMVRVGGLIVAVGVAGVGAALAPVPLVLPYVAWGVAGLGIGMAYSTISVMGLSLAKPGAEGSTASMVLLSDSLGLAAGAGLGGSAIAMAHAAGLSLRTGLAGAFLLAFLAAIALVFLCSRLPREGAGSGAVRTAEPPEASPSDA